MDVILVESIHYFHFDHLSDFHWTSFLFGSSKPNFSRRYIHQLNNVSIMNSGIKTIFVDEL